MGVDAQMLVRTRSPVTKGQVRKWAYELAAAFGHCVLFVQPPGASSFHPEGRHCLELVDKYTQDGPDIEPLDGETLIEVRLWGRYYGTNYERGDLPSLLAVARWLNDVIPGACVWYGGDSSGICAVELDAQLRDVLWAHFTAHGRAPYTHHDNPFVPPKGRQTCDWCGGAGMAECRWGGDGIGYICHGCQLHRLVAADGTITEGYKKWPDRE